MPLRKYQADGANMMATTHRQVILGDSTGTGKTITTLSALDKLQVNRVLLVCLKSKKLDWAEEIEKWSYGSVSIVGYNPDKPTALVNEDMREAQIKADARFCIINYELLARHFVWTTDPVTDRKCKATDAKGKVIRDNRHYPTLRAQKFDAIVVDEAHLVNGRKGSTNHDLMMIRKGCGIDIPVYLLTATPNSTGPEQTWALLHILDPWKFSSFGAWAQEECSTCMNYYTQREEIAGLRDPAATKKRLEPYVIRRSKEDCLLELPPVTIQTSIIPMDTRTEKAYATMKKKLYAELECGDTIEAELAITRDLRLQQICLSPDLLDVGSTKLAGPKIDYILDVLRSKGDQKVVIFSSFADFIHRLYMLLDSKYIKEFGTPLVFTGSINNKDIDRQKLIKRFGEDDSCTIMLTTIQSGGTGLNGLQVASQGIMANRMWAPPRNIQARGRLERIGQKNAVTMHNPVMSGSIEEKILTVLGSREALFDAMTPLQRVESALADYYGMRVPIMDSYEE